MMRTWTFTNISTGSLIRNTDDPYHTPVIYVPCFVKLTIYIQYALLLLMKFYFFVVPFWILQGKVIFPVDTQLCCHWPYGGKVGCDCDTLQCERFSDILLSW